MMLDKSLWQKLQVFLFIDRKLSDKPSSRMALQSRFNKLCSFFEDKDFNRENFNVFLGELKSKGYALAYVNKFISLGKHLDKFFKLGQLQDFTYFRESRIFRRDILTPEEIKRMAEIDIKYRSHSDYINTRQRTLILLLGTTGARIGEILGLKWDEIFFDPPFMRLFDTKNGDCRDVPIGREIYQMIQKFPKKNEKIFSSWRGGALELQEVNLDLKRRALTCGIASDRAEKITCHLFRHSFITTMLELGVDWLDLSVIIGHRDPKSTLRYKHNLLGHYVDVSRTHPLLKGEITLEDTIKKAKSNLDKIIDTARFPMTIEDNSEWFVVKIKKTQNSPTIP